MQMTIKDSRTYNYIFGNISPGTVFVVNNTFYMAIVSVDTEEGWHPLNAVKLDTGELTHFFATDDIQLVEAELCISDKN